MFDERIAELLDRKYAFVAKASPERFMLEAARHVEWLFAEDLIRPYALQVLEEDRAHRAHFIEYRERAFAVLCDLRAQLDRLYPNAMKDEAELDEDGAEYRTSLTRFDRLIATPKTIEDEEEDLERSPQQDPTTVGVLVAILQAQLRAEEQRLQVGDPSTEKAAFSESVAAQHKLHEYRFNERRMRLLTSPGRSLRNLLANCRSLNPPPDGVDDWMPFLARNDWKDAILKHLFRRDEGRAKRMMQDARSDLERVQQELHTLLGTSLSSLTVVSRFKERCDGRQLLLQAGANYSCRSSPGFIVRSSCSCRRGVVVVARS